MNKPRTSADIPIIISTAHGQYKGVITLQHCGKVCPYCGELLDRISTKEKLTCTIEHDETTEVQNG